MFYNVATGMVMMLARFLVIVPTLALAGALSVKPRNDVTRGTFSTDTLLFGALLVAVVLIVGALTFFPADALGPIVQQFDVAHGVAR